MVVQTPSTTGGRAGRLRVWLGRRADQSRRGDVQQALHPATPACLPLPIRLNTFGLCFKKHG